MADDNEQPPRGFLSQTASTAGQVLEKSGVKKWGIGEWGSVASIIGIGLWLLDQARRDSAAKAVELPNGRILYSGRLYAVADPLPDEADRPR